MNWPIFVAAIASTVAFMTLLGACRKRLSPVFCVGVFVSSALGAAAMQYLLSSSHHNSERLSSAHLAGVTALRLKDDARFIRDYIYDELTAETAIEPNVDWSATFKDKALDISARLNVVKENGFIRTYYSVWVGELEERRDQLDRIADAIIAVDRAAPRKASIDIYLTILDGTISAVSDVAHEMRTRPPERYFEP